MKRALPRLLAAIAALLVLGGCDDDPRAVAGGGPGLPAVPGFPGGPPENGRADVGAAPALLACSFDDGELLVSPDRGTPVIAAGGGRLYVATEGPIAAYDLGEGCALSRVRGFNGPEATGSLALRMAATEDGRLLVAGARSVEVYERGGGLPRASCGLPRLTTIVSESNFHGDFVLGLGLDGRLERVELNGFCLPSDDVLVPAPGPGSYLTDSAGGYSFVVEPQLLAGPRVARYDDDFSLGAVYGEQGPPGAAGVICQGLPAVTLCGGNSVCVADPTCSWIHRFSFDGRLEGARDLSRLAARLGWFTVETGGETAYAVALPAQVSGAPFPLRILQVTAPPIE